ncbi:glycoside hydrolase family 3 N-terminal domain-containing protein [Citricoccus nitrophenolicus]|uniref:glycoside hydrolase family 3 N-terminal domain-containing protein n=1 Tax=Citricoccus nitrophenolicus TaxID=863575 RepID=UPI0031EE00A6
MISSPPRRHAVLPLTALLAAALALTSCTAPGGPGDTGGNNPGTTPAPGPGTDGTGGAGPGGGDGETEPSALEVALDAPSEETRAAAAEAVAGMDTADQAGQVLVGQLGAAGTDPASIQELNLGGVIVMGDAVPAAADGTDDVEPLAARLEETQAALSAGRDWSGMVSVDQEGGLVARLQEPLTEWPTPMSYGAIPAGTDTGTGAGTGAGTDAGAELARAGHAGMGQELAELGFTVDFAPSVDVTIGAQDPAIGARSFSSDPERVATLGRAATEGLLGAGLLPAPKHFPGHGSVSTDSHVTAPVQESSLAELRQRDWLPFQQLLAGDQYTPMVMMGHIILPELEPEVPSSVSAPAYEALRGLAAPTDGAEEGATEGYDGVVVTDALNMGALVERYGADEAPVKALAAGADLLLMPSDLTGARDAITAAVDSGEVPAERLTEAAERVVTLLMWRDELAETLGQASEEEKAAAGVGPSDTNAAETSRAVSAASVTVVEGECSAPLVQDSLQVTGGTARDRARFTAAAEDAGLSVGSGPVVSLLGGAREPGQADVVVALDAPFGLASSSASDDGALVALYGRSPEAFAALVDVLTGEAEAPGELPVQVGEWPAGTGC